MGRFGPGSFQPKSIQNVDCLGQADKRRIKVFVLKKNLGGGGGVRFFFFFWGGGGVRVNVNEIRSFCENAKKSSEGGGGGVGIWVEGRVLGGPDG